jgi:hypothetical protein
MQKQRAPPGNLGGKLVDLGATTLNENNQHDDKEQTGDDANQSGAIHGETPFLRPRKRDVRKLVIGFVTLG